jgi:hypothetical protein
MRIEFKVETNNYRPAMGKTSVTFIVDTTDLSTEDLKFLWDMEQWFNSRTASRWHVTPREGGASLRLEPKDPPGFKQELSPRRKRPDSVEDLFKRIQALCENPHWTSERRWRISELASEGLSALAKSK